VLQWSHLREYEDLAIKEILIFPISFFPPSDSKIHVGVTIRRS
jgi:hypothetical protein